MTDTLIPTAIIFSIFAFIVLVIVVLRHKNDNSFRFDMHTLLKIYLYLMSFVTLIISIFGASLALKAGLSYAFGYDFSYNVSPYYTPVDQKPILYDSVNTQETMEIRGQRYFVDKSLPRRDLVNGSVLFISLFILFLIHRLSIHYLEKREGIISSLRRFYTFTSLLLYSLLGIIALPVAIYNLVNYFIFYQESIQSYSFSAPGDSLASAILIIPIWILFLIQVIRSSAQHKVENELSTSSK